MPHRSGAFFGVNMDPLTTSITAKAISKPFNDLYELGKDRFKSQLLKTKTTSNINKAHKSISSTHKVKTIWQIDKEVSLKSFYYPSKLIIDDQRSPISSIRKIPNETNVVIQGIVGQGKSIFLRYLSYQELRGGNRIPIFFELRRIEGNETLNCNLKKILLSLDFDTSDEIVDFLFKSGKIILLLDGFDEVPSDKVSRIISEIELLSEKYQKLKIIITSRPDSGIERSTFFRVYRLAPLQPQDIPNFLSKIIENKERRNDLTKAIETSPTKIQELLTTPLMLTLLVLVYRSENKIPEQLSDFYENLFILLLSRHDKTKPGYIRERSTHLNERKLQQVFEAFCFVTRRKELSTISHSEIHSAAEEAFNLTGVECDSSGFIKDITKVSNLILEEGYSYHFIHKSIQEFYAANYIKGRPEELAAKFYTAMTGLRHREWLQEINFLSQIDIYRHAKYLYIPNVSPFLDSYGINPNSTWADMEERFIINALQKFEVTLARDTTEPYPNSYSFGDMSLDYRVFDFASNLLMKLMNLSMRTQDAINSIALAIQSSKIPNTPARHQTETHSLVSVNFYDALKLLGSLEHGKRIVAESFKELHQELQLKNSLVSIEERSLVF